MVDKGSFVFGAPKVCRMRRDHGDHEAHAGGAVNRWSSQTNGKPERHHRSPKRDVNQVPYNLPADLEAAIAAFVSNYNYRRYQKEPWAT
jgi:hypothetical protein